MSYQSILAETPVPENYGPEDYEDDLRALIVAAQSAFSAFKKDEDFHAEVLQALERAHRLAMISGPHEHDDAEEHEIQPYEGGYGIFTRDQLGGDPLPGRPTPAMSWARVHESLDDALNEVRQLQDLDEPVYVGRFAKDSENTSQFWVNIVYYRTPEEISED